VLPDVPHVAVFDTAFHQTLAPAAYTYAIDREVAEANGVRRYGFHGTSHAYVSREAASFLGRPLEQLKTIVLHLGNGASVCAVDGGRSIETSMGMTPLEGLVMGTRSGDIDPAVLIHLHRSAGLGFDELDDLLNRRSGLLGLAGRGDMREVQGAADAGDEVARAALAVYRHRIRHYIGAYAAQLGGLDALVFTAGVGENSATLREQTVEGLAFLGIEVDPARNRAVSRDARLISPDGARVAVLVVPTNEELEIARQAAAITAG
jgi:acetate kinase